MQVAGSFRLLYFFDVSEEIQLEPLRNDAAAPPGQAPTLRQPAPGYVRFEEPPVIRGAPPVVLASGGRFEARVGLYQYGVVSVELDQRFDLEWERLVEMSAGWLADASLERAAEQIARAHLASTRAQLEKPYDTWLSEDYCIVHVARQSEKTAAELLTTRGREIARIVRGERFALAPEEEAEVLGAKLSYYPNDLLVVGWSAAFIYDSDEGAASTIELLKYANTQLLNFRHYDQFLTVSLTTAYAKLAARHSPFKRWRLAREAEKLYTVTLEVRELTEKTDTAIKFLSDMFDARLYRLAATRVGVPDFRRLVDDKLHTAGELYRFMMDQFQHTRAFLLELTVVVILIIDLVFLFRGKA